MQRGRSLTQERIWLSTLECQDVNEIKESYPIRRNPSMRKEDLA